MKRATSERISQDRTCRFRRVQGGGFRLAFELTRACDLRCRHCFVPRAATAPPLTEVVEVLRLAAAAGCRKLILTGGEPLLRGDLESIVRACSELGMLADLNSNLASLTSDRAKALRDAGLGEVSASLYGKADYHDWLTRTRGSFQCSLRGIAFFRELNVPVDVHAAVTQMNLEQAEEIVRQCEASGIASLSFFTIIPVEEVVSGAEPGTAHLQVLDRIAQLRASTRIPIRTIGLVPDRPSECCMADGILGVTAELRLLPCLLARPAGATACNLRQAGFNEALRHVRDAIAAGTWRPACMVACTRPKTAATEGDNAASV